MSTRISSLPAAETLTGAERFVVSQPNLSVTRTSSTISVDAGDNSYNDTNADFVALGFVVGMGVGVAGCANSANNIQQPSGVIEAVTATKLTISGPTLVTEAAGASITITQWMSRQLDLTTMTAGLTASVAAEVALQVGVGGDGVQSFVIAASDETSAFIAATGVVKFRMPYAFTLTGIRASLSTAQTDGSIVTVDVNKNGTSILTTLLTFDNGEKTTKTAASTAVLGTVAVADDDEITIDIDQIGDGTARGLKVTLIGYPVNLAESFVIPVTDEVIPITAGGTKLTMRMPYPFTLTGIRASVSTAQTSGALLTVDVNKDGVSLLATLLTFDNGEKTTTTAATPAQLTAATILLTDDCEITIDIDQIGDGTAKGLKVALYGWRAA